MMYSRLLLVAFCMVWLSASATKTISRCAALESFWCTNMSRASRSVFIIRKLRFTFVELVVVGDDWAVSNFVDGKTLLFSD